MKYVTVADIVLIVVLSLASLAGIVVTGGFGPGGKHVVVEIDGVKTHELAIGNDTELTVTGEIGPAVIVIKDGAVSMASSPCPNHYCERMGPIRRRGEIIVCVPNRIVISIHGGSDEDALDGVTQ